MEPRADQNASALIVPSDSMDGDALRALDKFVDPLLPRKGQALTWTTALGGLLFMPLLVGLRGLMSFLGGYCMA